MACSSANSSTNIDNMVKRFEKAALERAEQADQSTSDKQITDVPPTPALCPTDTEARMCIGCWLDIEETGSLWIATDCKPHQHLFHADCISKWWYTSGRRHCARCVQPVDGFTVYGRMADGIQQYRSYKATDPLDENVDMQHIVVDQSEILDELFFSDASNTVATCAALCPWRKRNVLAGDGTERGIRVWNSCREFLLRYDFRDECLIRAEAKSLWDWYDEWEGKQGNEKRAENELPVGLKQ